MCGWWVAGSSTGRGRHRTGSLLLADLIAGCGPVGAVDVLVAGSPVEPLPHPSWGTGRVVVKVTHSPRYQWVRALVDTNEPVGPEEDALLLLPHEVLRQLPT